jgi:hypothetical protein
MKKNLLLLLLSFPTFMFSQVVINQIDDFEDYTTRNWTKNNSIPNANIQNDGPLGSGDNFLRVSSNGTGTGLHLMTLNNAQWTGNYFQSNGGNRITYISMDVRNSGSEIIFLRMSFKYSVSTSTIEIWSTTNPIAVLPGEGWKKINFPIDQASVVRVSGLNPYTTTFSNVQEVRILHNDAPSWDSDPIEAVLDIDNIMARNSPMLGITEVTSNNQLVLFPNPANNFITIGDNAHLEDTFKFKIMDVTGRVVFDGNSKANEPINIESLTKGNYIIQIENDKGAISNSCILKN